MTQKNVTVRIAMEGGKVVEAQLLGIGQKGAAALGQVDQAAQKISTSTGAMRGNVQNAAFQVQDFFVQVSGGTSATRALSQQLPQLLGSFGLFGVLAGTAAAALIPMIGLLFDTTDPVKELTKDLDALNKAISALKSADRAAGSSVGDLEKEYGRYAEQAKEVLEIQRRIAEVTATRSFANASKSLAGAFGNGADLGAFSSSQLADYAAQLVQIRNETAALIEAEKTFGDITTQAQADAYEALQRRSLANDLALQSTTNYQEAVRALAADLNVTEAAAGQLAVAAAKVREAEGTEERIAAAKSLAQAIFDTTDGLATASDETINLYNGLLDANIAGLDLASLDIASGIRDARIEAERLADAMNFSAPDANGRIVDKSQVFANMRGRGVKTEDYLLDPPKRTRSGGGGGSGQSDQMRDAKRLYEETRTEAERFAVEQQKIDLLFQTGSIDADTYQRAIEMIKEKYMDGGDATKFFTDQTSKLEDAFLNLALTGEASFDAIAQSIERALLQAALFGNGPLGEMFGGGVFGGFAIKGGDLFANIAGARANGGPVMAGLSYLVGERGPELYTPSASGQIHKAGSFGGGASGGTTVQIIDQRSGGQAVQSETKTGPDGREIIVMTIRDATHRGELDKAQGRFGAKPRGVKR